MFPALRHLSRHVRHAAAAVLPSSCALCATSADDVICHDCRTHFFTTHGARCPQCANVLPHIPHGDDLDRAWLCGSCLNDPPAFDATVAATHYAPPVDQLVLALKFGAHLALAPLFAQRLRDALHTAIERSHIDAQPALLTIVPLGAQRLIERGFNQAQEIARPLAKLLDIPLHPQLAQRQRDTLAQSLLHPDERRKNMRNAFIVNAEHLSLIKDQHIGIIDDVMTTGETLNALAVTFKRAGAARITNFVFARAPL